MSPKKKLFSFDPTVWGYMCRLVSQKLVEALKDGHFSKTDVPVGVFTDTKRFCKQIMNLCNEPNYLYEAEFYIFSTNILVGILGRDFTDQDLLQLSEAAATLASLGSEPLEGENLQKMQLLSKFLAKVADASDKWDVCN